jgi:hypothetical protein
LSLEADNTPCIQGYKMAHNCLNKYYTVSASSQLPTSGKIQHLRVHHGSTLLRKTVDMGQEAIRLAQNVQA